MFEQTSTESTAADKLIFRWPVVVVWTTMMVLGFALLNGWAARPGEVDASPLDWPTASGFAFEPGRANLILFTHPLCPCTRATLHELEQIIDRAGCDSLSVRIVLTLPDGLDGSLITSSPVVDRAKQIPQARVLPDIGGKEAAQFGARTSGWTMLYDRSGHLRFAGGITSSRGHEGDNDGADAIVALLRDSIEAGTQTSAASKSKFPGTPVFGCPLGDAALGANNSDSMEAR